MTDAALGAGRTQGIPDGMNLVWPSSAVTGKVCYYLRARVKVTICDFMKKTFIMGFDAPISETWRPTHRRSEAGINSWAGIGDDSVAQPFGI